MAVIIRNNLPKDHPIRNGLISFAPKPAGERMMQNLHIVLLGDSIFDNHAYVPDGPSVIDHLRVLIPAGWNASLAAHDGDVVADVICQIMGMPEDATHLVVSAGGNDALNALGLLSEPATSVFDALHTLADIRDEFRAGYRAMLEHLKGLQLPLTVCTIYDCVPGLGRQEKAALALFNEIILREAFEAGLPVIDLRIVCQEETDYSVISPIEPSDSGGAKIAKLIAEMVGMRTAPIGVYVNL
jgi:hypothetical protein